jgi:GntR family transcriptional regulator
MPGLGWGLWLRRFTPKFYLLTFLVRFVIVVITSYNITYFNNKLTMLKSARASRTTLTEAAQQELRQAILQGIYDPGSQLPTEEELGAMLGVSRTVVREALRMLEEEGLIARKHGVGTFVRNRPILKNLNFNFGITEMIKSADMEPGTSYIAVRKEAASEELASQLDIAPETVLITIERVRTADGKPVVHSIDTFPEVLMQAHEFDLDRLLTESLYQILQSEFGHVIEYGAAQLLPAAATFDLAEKLEIPEGTLLLCITQLDYGPGDKPILYSREHHLTDAFDFVIWRRGPTKL